jgi:hypothetical protein
MTTLKLEDMTPCKFEPKFMTRWVLNIPEFDSFLFKKVVLEPLQRGKTDRHKMWVYMHDPVAPSGEQQVNMWITMKDNEPREVELCFLDPMGTVMSLRKFKDVVVEKVEFPDCDYGLKGEAQLRVLKLELSYASTVLEY